MKMLFERPGETRPDWATRKPFDPETNHSHGFSRRHILGYTNYLGKVTTQSYYCLNAKCHICLAWISGCQNDQVHDMDLTNYPKWRASAIMCRLNAVAMYYALEPLFPASAVNAIIVSFGMLTLSECKAELNNWF